MKIAKPFILYFSDWCLLKIRKIFFFGGGGGGGGGWGIIGSPA